MAQGADRHGQRFYPQAWTPPEAYELLRNIPVLESAGLVVRVPDWWKPRHLARPQVQVNLGRQAAGLGLDTMFDFHIELTLDGEPLSAAQWRELAAAGNGLVRLKGRWVGVDPEKLAAVLAHWKKVQHSAQREGISWAEGMRLLAGAALTGPASAEFEQTTAAWSTVVAGDWLRDSLAQLREPGEGADPTPELQAQLRPYQRKGVQWLWWLNRLGLGGCLADDVGLGKTVQVLGLLSLARREGDPGPHLLVVPASLIANWQAEAKRFAPHLRLLIAHPSVIPSKELAACGADQLKGIDIVVTSYACRFPFMLSLLLFHLAQLTLSMRHRECSDSVNDQGLPAERCAGRHFLKYPLLRRGCQLEGVECKVVPNERIKLSGSAAMAQRHHVSDRFCFEPGIKNLRCCQWGDDNMKTEGDTLKGNRHPECGFARNS